MDNDRAFMIYAVTLMTGLAAVLSSLVLAGIAQVPAAALFIEHLALALVIRGAYKSFGGFEWIHSVAEFSGWITEGAKEATAPQSGAQAAA